jgi:hypothetical protein
MEKMRDLGLKTKKELDPTLVEKALDSDSSS